MNGWLIQPVMPAIHRKTAMATHVPGPMSTFEQLLLCGDHSAVTHTTNHAFGTMYRHHFLPDKQMKAECRVPKSHNTSVNSHPTAHALQDDASTQRTTKQYERQPCQSRDCIGRQQAGIACAQHAGSAANKQYHATMAQRTHCSRK